MARSDALAALRGQRATRWFTAEPVADDLVTSVLEAARWTGSARNRQPWRFAVVTAAGVRTGLARLGAYAGHLAGAPVVIGLAADARFADAEFDAGRAAQTLMLAADALGLGTCPATFFPEANAAAATRLTGFAPPWRVRTAIALGHPAPAPPDGTRAVPAGRLPLAELRHDIA
ncbi:MAG TPA: nitroreductase family protein [Streptosporangiaceae bacterium]|jgi:nitroreductase